MFVKLTTWNKDEDRRQKVYINMDRVVALIPYKNIDPPYTHIQLDGGEHYVMESISTIEKLLPHGSF